MHRSNPIMFCLLMAFGLSVVAQENEVTPPVAGALPEKDTSVSATPQVIVPEIIPALLPRQTAPEIPLSLKETEAVSLAEGWKDKYSPATLGRYGQVIYHYGESIAAVITSPGNVTDILLEPGEVIADKGIFVGDSLNWEVSPLVQIVDNIIISHVIVKPFYDNLETTMTVLTNRRTYYFYLHSTPKRFMTSIAFNYPASLRNTLKEYKRQVAVATENSVATNKEQIPSPSGSGKTSVPGETLDFKYRLSGDDPVWTPVRIYSDNSKTYIQMPKRIRHAEAPVFVALSSSGDKQLVNYRVQGDTYIIDALVSAGLLISGVGKKQIRVRIDYDG